jgi:hypothetical protein
MTPGGTLLDRYAALYEKIAQTLQRELPAGWKKAWAYSEMSERDGSVVVYYLDGAAKVAWIDPPLALYERFRELNNAARLADPGQTWTTATFSLESGGPFNVDFGYQPIPIDGELARDTAWNERYLPSSAADHKR